MKAAGSGMLEAVYDWRGNDLTTFQTKTFLSILDKHYNFPSKKGRNPTATHGCINCEFLQTPLKISPRIVHLLKCYLLKESLWHCLHNSQSKVPTFLLH